MIQFVRVLLGFLGILFVCLRFLNVQFFFLLATFFFFLREHEIYQIRPSIADQNFDFSLIAMSQQQLG